MKVDVILTSFARWDLLTTTLESVEKHFHDHINNFIIYEDKGLVNFTEKDWDSLITIQRRFTFARWITPNERIGQIAALDVLMSKVKTLYYFNMEDDWEILKPGFFDPSLQILERIPECNQIQLRGPQNINGHPSYYDDRFGIYRLIYGYNGMWDGFGFNPSLRRKSDYDKIGNYSSLATFNPIYPWESEIKIMKAYSNMGAFTAVLPDTYIKHIGDERGIRS